METEIRYVALSGFREDGMGEIKGVFENLEDAVAVIRKEYDELCLTNGEIVAHKIYKEWRDDVMGYLARGEIRFCNDRFWCGYVRGFDVVKEFRGVGGDRPPAQDEFWE